jgi:hypothetical protein
MLTISNFNSSRLAQKLAKMIYTPSDAGRILAPTVLKRKFVQWCLSTELRLAQQLAQMIYTPRDAGRISVPTVLNEKAKKVCAMVPFDSFKTSSLMGP